MWIRYRDKLGAEQKSEIFIYSALWKITNIADIIEIGVENENDIEIYSTENEGKAVVVERLNRTLNPFMTELILKPGGDISNTYF